MTPERFRQIDALFQAVVELDSASRERMLRDACVGDAELLGEVQAMLDAHGEAETALAATIRTSAGEAIAGERRRIGPYRIEKEIGHGGMGAVFLAERDDGLRKRVAIKLIKRGMDTEEILRRFQNERQIQAALDHPYIAKLLDGGSTEDGLPYFVMEYVEGQPVDRYCEEQKLTTRERLVLFRKVCEAVQCAHQNLVVHRDIKPSNILVNTAGMPVLLDFGIAKFLNPEMVADGVWRTATQMRIMTPGYASPEQMRGEAVTTATDVYSLGVLLYELLSGRLPFAVEEGTVEEISRRVATEEPARPSEGMASALTRREVRGDLDNIVLMALRKEPRRRYASVEQFSEDIRRHLENLPVVARKDTFGYRAGKFMARNRIAMGFSVVLLAMAVGFVGTVLVQSRRVAGERDKAQKLSAFLVDLFKVADPTEGRGEKTTARELLEKGAQRLTTELKDSPEASAPLAFAIAKAHFFIGLWDKAEVLALSALETQRKVYGNRNKEVMETLTLLADIQLQKANKKGLEEYTRQSLECAEEIYGKDGREVATRLSDYAIALRENGQNERALGFDQRALAVLEKHGAGMSVEAGIVLSNLAHTEMTLNRTAAAIEHTKRSVEVLRVTKGEGRELALSLNNLQYLYNKQGQYAEAEVACREALDICRRVFGDRHPETALRMNNLARVMLNLHRVEEAIRYGKEALEIRRGVLKADHPSLALSKQLVGDALVEGGRAAEGEPYLREASETLLSQAGYRGGLAAAAWGRCLMALGRYEEAAVAFEKSVERLKVSPSLERVTIQDVNGWVAELRGKAQQAAAGRASPGRR